MSIQNGNLDLTKVDTQDFEKLAHEIEEFYQHDSTAKNQLAWAWERNHLMIDGKQWLRFEGSRETGGMWRPLQVTKSNEYIPKPTTNYIFDAYQTLKSYLIKNKPRSSVTPNTQSSRDKSSAKIADLILETNWERLGEPDNYEYAASCLVAYGTIFKKDYWDSSSLMMAKVPRMEQRPVVDPTTGQPTGAMEDVPSTDPMTGEALFDEIPLGDVNTDIVEPQRLAIDPLATTLRKARWIIEYSIQPLGLVQELYGRQEEGYTGLAAELEPEKNLSSTLQRFLQLKTSSGVKMGLGSSMDGLSASAQIPENCVVLKEYYERPSLNNPKGRMVVVGNGKTLYSGESPCEGPDIGDWHPYSECRWEILPGRFHGKGPIDDAVEIQKSINSIDSVVILTRKTTAVPQKLIPVGSGIERGTWTGRPGQEIYFRSDPSGKDPMTVPGVGVDSTVFQERAQRVEDLKTVTGAIDILKGDRPPGVNAASALNLLYEVGTGKLFPILDRWKNFVESSQKKQLRLVAKKYREPRPDFIKMLKAKNRDLSEEAISHFIGEDLYDNCNVVVEAGSNIPKLQAAKQAALQEAAATGVLNLQLPANRMEYQRQMGISGFDNDVGPDIKRAEWENDILDDAALNAHNKPIVLAVDNHQVHTEIHSNRMKEPAFMSLPAEVQQAYMAHIQEHEQFQQQAMQAQMIQQMSMGQMPGQPQANHPQGAPGPQGPGTTPAPQNKMNNPAREQGNGVTAQQKNAMSTDMLVPAPIGGARK